MKIPGFTARESLYQSEITYSRGANSPSDMQAIIPQARPVGGGIGGGGGLGFHWPSRCEISCAVSAAACNIGCASAGPGYLVCLAGCAAAEIACLAACNSYTVLA
jgi:hypothetical protein